ncbi:MAG: hypothetical protein NVS3B20_11720 [Polyangiales bacterium]
MKVNPVLAVVILGLIHPVLAAEPADRRHDPGTSAAASASSSAPANLPSNITEARQRFARGLALYDDGNYNLALIEFQRSYALAPQWRVLYNIGAVYYQLHDYAAALKTLKEYLKQGGAEIPPKRRAEVDTDITELEARTAVLIIRVSVPGAEIKVRDVILGTSPLNGEQLVAAGELKIAVSKPGYLPAEQVLSLAGGDRRTVDVSLEKVIDAPPPPPEPPSYVWVGWAITGVLGASTLGTGIATLSAKSDLDALLKQRNVSASELQSKSSQYRTFTLATEVLAGATLLAAGASLYFTLASSKATEHKKKQAMDSLRLSAGWRSVGLTVTF